EIYRERFEPSERLAKPYVMPAVNVFAADTDAEARRAFTSLQQQFARLRRGAPGKVPPPVDDIGPLLSADERISLERTFAYAFVGDAGTVKSGLKRFIEMTGADELMIAGQFYDHRARL